MHLSVETCRVHPLLLALMTLVCFATALVPNPVYAANEVTLVGTLPSIHSVGSVTTWTALPATPSDTLVYQFSVAALDQDFQTVRDFSTFPFFQFTPLEEGIYQVRTVMKDRATGETWRATELYGALPLVSGDERAVIATPHPLVALYSMPSCANGYVRVRYRAQGALFWEYTHWRPCASDKTVNFYVGGMRAATTYQMQDEKITSLGVQRSATQSFTAGDPSISFPAGAVADPVDGSTSLQDRLLLFSPLFGDNKITFPYAVDLFGRPVWYYPNLGRLLQLGAYLMRPVYGGTMLMTMNYVETGQMLREIDLAGNIVRETNTTEVNEQMIALGEDTILSFHHDAVRLANGRTLVLANTERILEDVQGEGPVTILGDLILELDENFRVTWVWNSFEKLDVTRAAVLNEICLPGGLDCAGETTAPDTRDWTHSNSIDYDPGDGNLVVSMRNQDWAIKIDYQNGAGDGDVIWRFGKDGDFTIDSVEPWPWFSHQHYARYWADDTLVLFDNGNTRCLTEPQPCNSRGQVYTLDEENLTTSLAVNADTGLYAHGWGDGMRLRNGNYHFTASTAEPYESRSLEVGPTGNAVYRYDTTVAIYRSFRMTSLYVPEVNPVHFAGLTTLAALPLGAAEGPEQIETAPIYLPYVNAGAEAVSVP